MPARALHVSSPSCQGRHHVPATRSLGGRALRSRVSKYGRFKSFTAANGTTHVEAAYDAGGYLTSVTQSDAATGVKVRYVYSYTGDPGFALVTNDLVTAAGGTPPRMIARVTMQRSTDDGGSWPTTRSADYTYYTGRVPEGTSWGIDDEAQGTNTPNGDNDPNGRLGDLKLVQVKDDTGAVVDTKHYRYYKFTGEGHLNVSSEGPTNNRTTTGGPPASLSDTGDRFIYSGLKSVVEGPSFARLVSAGFNYDSALDTEIRPYVNHYYEYGRWADHFGTGGGDSGAWRMGYRLGSRFRVTKEIAQGAGCSSCGSGMGTFSFEYAHNDDPDATPYVGYNEIDYNVWRMRSTEILPDGTESNLDNDRNIVYVTGYRRLNPTVMRTGRTARRRGGVAPGA